ncbi:hypothetical protein J3A83DRAFT_1994631 [Scleroderma citrinum]
MASASDPHSTIPRPLYIALPTLTFRPQQGSLPNPPVTLLDPGLSQQRQSTSRHLILPLIGFFQGSVRLLQFNDQLSNENPSKDKLSFWNSWVAEHFTPEASVKFTLWKDNKKLMCLIYPGFS